MKFIILNEKVRTNAIEYIKQQNIDKPLQMDIKPYKRNRTLSQNNLYWMWIPYLAEHFGYTEEEMHDELKYAFLGETTYINRKGIERVKPISTTTLKTKGMADYLTKVEVLANKEEIKLPIPDDYKFAMMHDKDNLER